MRGYPISSSKIRGKSPFEQNSRSKQECPFLLDQDVDLDPSSRSKQNKDDQEQPFNAGIEKTLRRRDPHWLFKGQLNGGERKAVAPTLRRNFSATSSLYQRNKSSKNMLERQSSSRSNIQGAMKRAFSMKLRRSSSATSQPDEYRRIINDQDQSFRADDHDDIDKNTTEHEVDYYYNVDHQEEESDAHRNNSNGQMEKRSFCMKQKGSNPKSKVLKACKRLLSRKFA